jgi:hypothetical protein
MVGGTVVDVVVVEVVAADVEVVSVVADSTPLPEASSSLLDPDAHPAVAIAATPIKTFH